jgi:hypothetical protein
MMNKPKFGLWVRKWGLTIRFFGVFAQVMLRRHELFSQRHDPKRWRFFGLSCKLGEPLPHRTP